MKNEKIGHNNPPLTLEDFIIKDKDDKTTGRVKFTNTLLKKYLVRKVNAKSEYAERIINDSEKVGLKAKVSPGGSKTLFFQYLPKGKKFPVKYMLGKFPEMGVDAARSLVESLKTGIVLGQDPRSVIAERMKAKTLNQVISSWKEMVLHKSTRFAASSIKNTEQRLMNWISLKAYKPATNKVILNFKKDLDIGSMKMVEINKDHLVAWHAAVTVAGPYQANRTVDDLKVIFKWAVDRKILKENICKFTKHELNEQSTRLDDTEPYSKAEWRSLRKAVLTLTKKNPRVFIACMGILLSMLCGRRYKSEVLSLKWTQIDWDAKKVRLLKTKTGKSEFSINKLSYWVLIRLWKYRNEKYKGQKLKSNKAGYLFPSIRKAQKPYIQDVRKTWEKICSVAGVRCEEPYMLRHTWGCFALEATNGNFAAVKDEGGWKTFEMVMIYAKYNKMKLARQSQVIGNFLATANG
jgi:integrase